MVWIYILELTDGKYYVGKSDNPDIRIEDHFNGSDNASAWTKKYPPVKIIEKIANCDDYDEDKYTKMYMDKYGIDNVRGGSYVTITLDKSTIKHLQQASTATNDRCFQCNKSGHFVKNCPEITGVEITVCERCGRNTHNKGQCYAKRHLQGYIIKDDSSSESEGVNDTGGDSIIDMATPESDHIVFGMYESNVHTQLDAITSTSNVYITDTVENTNTNTKPCAIILAIFLVSLCGGLLIGRAF